MPDTVTTYGIFKSHSLFYTKIFVIDTNEYLSVRLASEIGIEVKVREEYALSSDSKYRCLFLKIKKKDFPLFEQKVLNNLVYAQQIRGYDRYEDICRKVMKFFEPYGSCE